MNYESIKLGRVVCDFLNQDDWLTYCQRAFAKGGYHHIVTLNPEMVLLAHQNQLFLDATAKANLRVPDGAGLIWARWYLRSSYWLLLPSLIAFVKQPVERITGVDAIMNLAQLCLRHKRSVFIVGGNRSNIQKTVVIMKQKFPGLITTVSASHDYNEITSPEEILQEIRRVRPGVVMVAYGAPEQTVWLETHRQDLANAGIIIGIGVGGAFDILSEKLPRAPASLRAMNLEWLWRLYLEPKRLPRIINAVWHFPYLMKKFKKGVPLT